MNERIKQLAEQAWNHVDAHCPYASEEQEMFQEKFAELLIASTFKLTAQNMGYSEYMCVKHQLCKYFELKDIVSEELSTYNDH